MPDGALHAGRCGRERARDLRIEHLRDRIDDVHIVHRDHDRLAQILITLDVRRHADLMDDRSDKRLDVGVIAPRGCLFSSRHHLADPVCHGPAVARLAHKILHAKLRRHRPDIFGHKPGHHQCPRRALQLLRLFQHCDPVHLRQHQIQCQYIRMAALHQFAGAHTISRNAYHRKLSILLQCLL